MAYEITFSAVGHEGGGPVELVALRLTYKRSVYIH
jgi:hypothetical protein